MDTQKTTKETTVKSAIISTKLNTKYRVLRTIFMSHAEYETLATHAWRVRTLGGHLLVEVAPGDLTAPPAAESGGVVTVYVNECQW